MSRKSSQKEVLTIVNINYDIIQDLLSKKYTEEHDNFLDILENDNLKVSKSNLKPIDVAFILRGYTDNQMQNFANAFKLYSDLVNRAFDKFTTEIKKLKQENKEMQQTINKLMSNSDSNKN